MLSKLTLGLPLVLALVACGSSSSGEETASTPCTPLADGSKVTDQAVTADGRYVTVLGSGPNARIFYGPADHMVEGHITGSNAGCFQSYDFTIGSAKYTAVLAYASCNGNIVTRFYRDGATPFEPMTLVTALGTPAPNAAPASNPRFYCF